MMVAPGRDPRDSEEREELAAIAALEGLGVLTPRQRAMVDEKRVRVLEQAAGALFTAMGRHLEVDEPVGASSRIESILAHRAAAAQEADRARGSHWHDTLRDVPQRERMEAASPSPRSAPERPAAPAAGSRPAALGGWLAAAALLVATLFTFGRMTALEAEMGAGPAGDRRAELIATVPDVQVLEWSTEGVAGDVAWSDARNEGYMRIDGLEVNDPTRSQYQLWIFRGDDPSKEAHPVSGGVFDVTAEGEVVIPIDAQLEVDGASIFAVTVEPPGGVMVSDREQIVLVASRA